ncbi:MAG: hypothetical protein Kow0027_08800 [Saprospiraceae bacterium]
MEKENNSTSALIIQEFELENLREDISEEELFRQLSDRIAWLIEHNMEYLMSLLYRNDVAEDKIYHALSLFEEAPANEALARLVLDRQKQRMETKKKYGKQASKDVDEDLRW